MNITKKSLLMLAMAAALVCSCSDDNDQPEPTPEPQPETSVDQEITDTEMRMWGTLKAGTVLNLDRHLVVPAGKSLTIEEGVQIIVSTAGVGVNHTPVEITVDGNLYAIGSSAKPILFSVDPSLRTDANAVKGLWGGIVGTESCAEMVLDNVIIEYTGAEVIEGSPAATAGIYTAGDDAYPQVTTNNINGKYVITNSTIRYGASDGIYLMGGNAIVTNNIFAANGATGGEAVNMKAGVVADVAGNVMFSPNTNGLKLSSSGQSETRSQAKVNAYNNTIINAGWRRDGEKGGSIYVEKNILVNIVNNLIVNCKFRAMTPKYTDPNKTDGGYDDKSLIDYNFYTGGTQAVEITGEATVGNPLEGYNQNNKNYNPAVDTHSIIASVGNPIDPGFLNFNINQVPLTQCVYNSSWSFGLKSGAAALSGANGSLTPYFAGGMLVGSTTYSSPAVQPYFGALGLN